MAAYYNEIDPFAAAWLRQLIAEGWIADGDVDARSITDVRPADLRGFDQCHFFAGIGGWSYALRLAGWPDDRPVWTGSCPCQPFSSAGAQAGYTDPRDLWPAWFRLLAECRPDVVFGEQVEAAIRHGWLDRLCADVEREGYAVGAVSLPAAGVGAFHLRQRLWFVAESESLGHSGRVQASPRAVGRRPTEPRVSSEGDALEHTESERTRREAGDEGRTQRATSSGRHTGAHGGLADDHERRRQELAPTRRVHGDGTPRHDVDGRGEVGGLGDAASAGPQGRAVEGTARPRREGATAERTSAARADGIGAQDPGVVDWTAAEWIPCLDGKARPIEPGTCPLADGVPARVGRLRGYGNAIVPQVAAAVIAAYLETRADLG